MPEGCAAIQRDLDRLENWAGRNLVKHNKDKRRVLHLGKSNSRHRYKAEGAGSIAWRRDLMVTLLMLINI